MERIPITILGGSDGRPGPADGPTAGLHPLATYKGAALQVGGRSIAALLVERLRASGAFGPVRIAGPAAVYEPLGLDAEVVDTDGPLVTNLRAAIEHHRWATTGPLALLACDVLPRVEELTALRAEYERALPCALWFPLVPRGARPDPRDVHAWKPAYRIHPERGAPPREVLPGHLGIFAPEALRLSMVHRLLGAAYLARNRSIQAKRAAMLRAVLGELIADDLHGLVAFQAPTRTVTTLWHGLGIARRLLRDELVLEDLERSVAAILLRRGHRRRSPASSVRLPLMEIASIANDVDTLEEARALEDGDEGEHAPEAGGAERAR